jgi:hypothetical protein
MLDLIQHLRQEKNIIMNKHFSKEYTSNYQLLCKKSSHVGLDSTSPPREKYYNEQSLPQRIYFQLPITLQKN